uniref:Putative endoglucanase n=1 Tax=uncultured bacterium Ad_125_D08 TaxID=1489285 RepID=A0A0B4N169_9BACT|nr:putative endoglucanase [uncultured bacterium Ad_125_D08]
MNKNDERKGEATMNTCFDRHGALRVSGTQLLDEAERRVQLRGVSTLGLAWYPEYVNEAAFRTLRDGWGANTVRLAMYTCESGGYMTGGDRAALEALIDRGVKLCAALGLYVIIDWHILSDGDPNTHADAAEDFFGRISARYAGQPHVLYEICNEPNGPAATWPAVKRYARRIIPVIRANAPDAVILCGTPNWSQDVDLAAADPLDDGNLMYALHFYAATHKEALREKAERALAAGAPLFITEFSICDASGDGAIDYDSAAAWRALIAKHGLSYVAWSLSNRDESAALIRADCPRTSDWTDDDLTDTGRWLKAALNEDRLQ